MTKKILLGVTGGIACYKSVHLCRLMVKAGYEVKVIMTEAACRFVTPLTFQAITGNRVYTGEFEAGVEPEIIEHVWLAGWADEFIIAPATANIIAKIAHGMADDLLTSTVLPYKKPIRIAPSMNVDMYANPVTQKNLALLASLGHDLIDPNTGEMACRTEGKGRMAEPEEIFDYVFSQERPLTGLKVLVTAGATAEAIDPVRFITNRSSGKMGLAVAKQAQKLGAEVKLIAGLTSVSTDGFDTVKVQSALEMLEAVKQAIEDTDILVMAAAVADFRAAEYSDTKIKKTDDAGMTIRLVKNPDILKELAPLKKDGQVFVGFAAESDNLEVNAQKKLTEKKLDMIAANDISRTDIGFEADNNEIVIFSCDREPFCTGKVSKDIAAEKLLTLALELYGKKNGSV
ncbi:bifunctional phosphopantothenoylcysteine decarboxylase/phosphopantothenate--cysteine ligase CoaBC [Seleniivibrio sp.]|uniref:bifunctional phosphopantothenoylcysteine decarboxylase/phosphopantothenate--cysteine ligase CoaBC n=1 Tax=Seleniivibrio sp. TaxID=2898801 RepID=UPI0026007296|nr:bifunctional phosphopantothenoylcysteine decarboxylase/phosphopantothenate--cysteine ligase CoaBC [Seleniivibrio sp.]MCD8552914.1 bifunctional phosphopantothenoylcysteine decarboxylase/phosphopantothenate--cysteine ligase CoaBC [Seleniivibrio sp.]